MSDLKISAEVLLQDEMLCLRILRRIANPTVLSTLNLEEEACGFTFVKAMALLVKYGLVDISDEGNIARTQKGKEIMDNVIEILNS